MFFPPHPKRDLWTIPLIVCAACLVAAGCRANKSDSSKSGSGTTQTTSTANTDSEKPERDNVVHSGKPAHGRPVAIAAGWTHVCLQTDSDDLYCWGMNAGGEVGDGTINQGSPFDNVRSTPFHLGKIQKIKTLALGNMLSLALAGDGAIWVWGSTIHLEPLRDGKYKEHLRPEKLGVDVRLQMLSTSGGHACGIDAQGQVHCWGTNDYGELGDGTNTPRQTPKRVELPEPATSVSVAGHHSCVVVKSGAVYCWGLDPRGRPLDAPDEPPGPLLGPPQATASPWANTRVLPGPPPHATVDPHHPEPKMHSDKKPVRMEGLDNTAAIALGEGTSTTPYACALGRDSIPRCWGANERGQLADGTYIERAIPKPIKDIVDAISIHAAGARACVIRKDHSVWCWGLRYGISPVSPIPIREPLTNVRDIALGTDFACAIHGDGIVSCWGDNRYSQLGIGSQDSSTVPVSVAF